MHREIILTSGATCKISTEDYNLVSKHTWYEDRYTRKDGSQGSYAFTKVCVEGKKQEIRMHRLILGFPVGSVDHANRDGLDNRRENLRLADGTQQCANRAFTGGSSKYKGVSFEVSSGKWKARIGVRGKYIYLGRYKSEKEAALAYDAAANFYFGEFSNPNLTKDLTDAPNITRKTVKNTSIYRGVSYWQHGRKWLAQINHQHKHHHIGYFETEEDAAIAYNQKAEELLGDKARLNHVPGAQ
jgi:hypothetical protein